MPRKSWVEKAAETGDWSGALAKAKQRLRTSGAKIVARRAQKERSISRAGENETPEVDSLDTRPDRVEELIEDEFSEDADPLPSDEEEKVLAQADKRPAVTLAELYRGYLERGGNRRLTKRVLDHLGSVSIDQIDRSAIIDAGLKLYPRSSQAERTELVHDPLEEIVGSSAVVMPATTVRRGWDECRYWLERKAELHAAQQRWNEELRRIVERNTIPEDEFWAQFRDWEEFYGPRWATISFGAEFRRAVALQVPGRVVRALPPIRRRLAS